MGHLTREEALHTNVSISKHNFTDGTTGHSVLWYCDGMQTCGFDNIEKAEDYAYRHMLNHSEKYLRKEIVK